MSKSALNNPGLSDSSIGRLSIDNHIIRAHIGLQPTVSSDCNVSSPITMVGLKQDKAVEGNVTVDFEQKGFAWMDKEKLIPGPVHIPEDDELTGDMKFT